MPSLCSALVAMVSASRNLHRDSGLLGVIVPWLFERMGRTKKAIWTLVMFALVYGEIRTLYLDRDQHDREQAQANCEQIERFGAMRIER